MPIPKKRICSFTHKMKRLLWVARRLAQTRESVKHGFGVFCGAERRARELTSRQSIEQVVQLVASVFAGDRKAEIAVFWAAGIFDKGRINVARQQSFLQALGE
jgi:hypothetical protein